MQSRQLDILLKSRLQFSLIGNVGWRVMLPDEDNAGGGPCHILSRKHQETLFLIMSSSRWVSLARAPSIAFAESGVS